MIIKQPKLRKIVDEAWRDIPNTNKNYQVSNYGRVRSFVFHKKEGHILKSAEINGFKQLGLTINKIRRGVYVHKLVAEVWIPRPSDKHTLVTHLDENLINNHVSNLEWHTEESLLEKHREFAKQKYDNPNCTKSVGNSKLKVPDIMLLKSMLERGVTQSKIAKMFCISEMQVTRIKRGENWGQVKAAKHEYPSDRLEQSDG